MQKQGRFILLMCLCLGLSSCLGTVWSGAKAIYDRHSLYLKLNDYELLGNVNHLLGYDNAFESRGCIIDVAVFNRDVLIAGHVPTDELKDKLQQRLKRFKGYRRLFVDVSVRQIESNRIQDSWITAKIRSQIFGDSSIDPNAFKVLTSDGIVYLMGDVRREEATKVIDMARTTDGALRVVKMFRYFTYQK